MSNEIAAATTNGDSPKKIADASNTSDTPLKATTDESEEQQASPANNTADNPNGQEIAKETTNDDDTSMVTEEDKPNVQNGDVKKNTATPEPSSESAGIQLKTETKNEPTDEQISVVTQTLPTQTIPPVKTDEEGDIQMVDAPKNTNENNNDSSDDTNTHSKNEDQTASTTSTTATTTTTTSTSGSATTTATSIEISELSKDTSPAQTTQPTQQSPQVPKTEVEPPASIKPDVSSTDEVMLDVPTSNGLTHSSSTASDSAKTNTESITGDNSLLAQEQDSGLPSLKDLQKQTHTIVIPSYACWFNQRAIHKIEKQSLPEFFNSLNKNKTPAMYTKYRNFMINSYRLNPNEYLSFTAVRRNLVGDAGALLRVHKFLDKWGLINYQVNPETRPTPIEPPFTGEFAVDLDTPRGMFPFETYKPPAELPDLTHVKALLSKQQSTSTTTANGVSNGESSSSPKKAASASASTPGSTSDSLTVAGTTTGNNTITKSDREENEPPAKKQKRILPDIDHGWTAEELKKLLEGIKKFKDEWQHVADYVGTKTAEECIIRFLQLPIEDKFLEKNRNLLGPLKYIPNLSFSSTDNPIMSTLAFLSRLVDPEVAAAASARAIKVADEKLTEKLNADKVLKDPNAAVEDPLDDIKDAAINAMGVVGARSHVFACYEEREMNKSLVNIIQSQLKIVDLKLSKLTALEKEFEYQRKQLSTRNNEIFLDKLAIFKSTNAISSKLLEAIETLEHETSESNDKNKDGKKSEDEKMDEGDDIDAKKPDGKAVTTSTSGATDADLTKAKKLIAEARDLIFKPPKKHLNILEADDEGGENNNNANDEDLKPVSFEVPQLYRYWSG
ncbi:unnamed protein product [Ambrosiozyma monospora]|uniref:Unnamed protein product n=1 Tax=Ambrosiozyma monospora TaxID=43982 RepID=A0A9W7DDW2_AMBMO|nr:unnamed protein product [Ambrosiozyma monospora]